MTPPHPAATLILLREPNEGPPELLMIQRAATMGFGAGAWVFPGGRVDPGDVTLAARFLPANDALDDHAARICAIRETIEEVGLALGLDPPPDPATLAAVRAGLHAGEPFAGLLDRFGLSLVPDALLHFSRWCPPAEISRRFDTRFYLARLHGDAKAEPDGRETVALLWTTPRAMLDRADARIMFPTACNLRRLLPHRSFAEAEADAAAFPAATIVTRSVDIGGERFVQIDAGHGYPETRSPLAGLFRG
ncbi:NUDIX domain-containing protein [Sphingomonas sp. AP4-R1]|nr:NUDIX domain-containing protein [Sphingomonas sp. AP4-R1]